MRTSDRGDGSGCRFGLIRPVSATRVTGPTGILQRLGKAASGRRIAFHRSHALVATVRPSAAGHL